MEAQLSEPSTYSDKDKFKQTEMSYQKLSNDLKQLNAEYEATFEKVMELESKVGWWIFKLIKNICIFNILINFLDFVSMNQSLPKEYLEILKSIEAAKK